MHLTRFRGESESEQEMREKLERKNLQERRAVYTSAIISFLIMDNEPLSSKCSQIRENFVPNSQVNSSFFINDDKLGFRNFISHSQFVSLKLFQD